MGPEVENMHTKKEERKEREKDRGKGNGAALTGPAGGRTDTSGAPQETPMEVDARG